MADIISEIVAFFVQLLAPYTQIPQSTFMTVGMAVMVGLISATASKLLVNYDMVRNSMREFQQWRKDVDKARKANDEQGLSKLMKKQQAMTKLQALRQLGTAQSYCCYICSLLAAMVPDECRLRCEGCGNLPVLVAIHRGQRGSAKPTLHPLVFPELFCNQLSNDAPIRHWHE